MLNAGYVDVADYAKQGWLTGLKYEDDIFDDLIQRTKSEEDKLKKVSQSYPCSQEDLLSSTLEQVSRSSLS